MKATKETAEVNAAFAAGIRQHRYARRGIVPPKFSGAMPSPAELATLAAALARAPADNPETLCATALKLWFASHETIAMQQQCNEDHQQWQLEAARNPLPEPPENQEWPITLDAFCKMLWPAKDTGERAAIIRAWLKTLPKERLSAESEPEEVTYATMNSEPIDKRHFYFLLDSILPWYQQWKAPVNSAVKSNNAKKGWGDCDAKTQKEPLYQAYKAECDKLGRKTNKRGFHKWLKTRIESPEAKLERALKKITSRS